MILQTITKHLEENTDAKVYVDEVFQGLNHRGRKKDALLVRVVSTGLVREFRQAYWYTVTVNVVHIPRVKNHVRLSAMDAQLCFLLEEIPGHRARTVTSTIVDDAVSVLATYQIRLHKKVEPMVLMQHLNQKINEGGIDDDEANARS